jgi:hypothetical protein
VLDADSKDVSYERLLLPFGFGERVDQIIGLLKAISVEGGFKVTNLMGLHSRNIPVRVIDAVIDREISTAPASGRAVDDVVELS